MTKLSTNILLKITMLITLLFLTNATLMANTTYQAVTAKNTNIPDAQFAIMIGHLNKDKLFVEADAWLKLLEISAENVSIARLGVKKQTEKIKIQKEKTEALEEKTEALEEKTEALEEKTEVLKEKSEATVAVKTKNAEKEAKKIEADVKKVEADVKKVEADVKKVEAEKEKIEKKKLSSLEKITELREIRTAISDKLNLILLELNERIGTKDDGTELEEVLIYRRYMDSVGGVAIDVSDSTSALVNLTGWVISEQGGIRWLINIATFILIIFLSMIVSFILSNAVKKALKVSRSKSQLLNDFIINIINKVVMLAGLLIALSSLEINVGPIMAIVGAAGFVVAFALQGTLSNFASGIMMMLYRPFDIEDVVEVAGIIGTVKSMNLVSTTIMTADNRSMLIPNNTIWGDVITNITSSGTRRIDMTFGIGYGDDMAKAQGIMEKILENHPFVLQDPAPTIKVHELADSSVNFICRPWVKTDDYWATYWEITRTVKEHFDDAGISIPFPQTDVHIIKDIQAT